MNVQKNLIFFTACALIIVSAIAIFYYPSQGYLTGHQIQEIGAGETGPTVISRPTTAELQTVKVAVQQVGALVQTAQSSFLSVSTCQDLASVSSQLESSIGESQNLQTNVQGILSRYSSGTKASSINQDLSQIGSGITYMTSLKTSAQSQLTNCNPQNPINPGNIALGEGIAGDAGAGAYGGGVVTGTIEAPIVLSPSSDYGSCKYPVLPFDDNAVAFGSVGLSPVQGVTEGGLVIQVLQPCAYSPPTIDTADVDGDTIVITNPNTGLPTATISFSPPSTSPGVFGEVITQDSPMTINFFNGRDTFLSPPVNSCYNQVPDVGEEYIDCGGICGPCGGAQAVSFSAFFFWILFGLLAYSLFYFNSFGEPKIMGLINKGSKALMHKDFRKAISCYKYSSHYYYHLDEQSKMRMKQAISSYYKNLRKELNSAGIAVHKAFRDGELPELIYDDKKIGLMKFGSDLHRISELIEESLKDLNQGRKKEAFAQKKVIVGMYDQLSKDEKGTAEKKYRNYLAKFLLE